MAYELKPRHDRQLSANEVAKILAAEFAYMKVDAEGGQRHARKRAEWMENAPARIFLGHHRSAMEAAIKLKNLELGEALVIEFGDDQANTLRAIVMPGEAIRFGFGSNEEQGVARPLVERCARVLDCDVVVI